MNFRFLPGYIKPMGFKPQHRPSVRKFHKVDTKQSPLTKNQPPVTHKIHEFFVAHTRKSARTRKFRLTKWMADRNETL